VKPGYYLDDAEVQQEIAAMARVFKEAIDRRRSSVFARDRRGRRTAS